MTKEEILSIRTTMGLNQARFAYLIGTTLTTVCRWENGRSKPRAHHARTLLSVKVTQDYIKRFYDNKSMLVR